MQKNSICNQIYPVYFDINIRRENNTKHFNEMTSKQYSRMQVGPMVLMAFRVVTIIMSSISQQVLLRRSLSNNSHRHCKTE